MSGGISRQYVIAVDIGTTSTKTLAVRTDGSIAGSYSVEYPLNTPKPEFAEQNPEEIRHAVSAAVRGLLDQTKLQPKQLLCVSFSSAMHSLIAVDKQNRPLTPCITWADNRAKQYIATVKDRFDGHSIYLRTGTPIHPMSPLLKLMWLRDHQPEIFAQTYKFVGIKEYVLASWFGKYVIDYSIASATGLFNLNNLDWDRQALETAGVSPEQLSTPVNTTYLLEGLQPERAEEMGLLPDIPVIVGASDGVLANLGAGAFEPGVYAVTIGTSGAVRGVVRKPLTDPQGRLFCYALKDDFWVIGGPINNGGIMFRWVRDQLATLEAEEGRRRGMDPYDYLTSIAEQVVPGSEGLIFLPFLAGERAPYWNANARGVFFGLSLQHQKKHMIRAVLEGVMYRIQSVVSALEDIAGPSSEIRASGGFARSALWRQMLADVLGTDVMVPDAIESSGLGAALLGMMAVGEIDTFDSAHQWIRASSLHQSQPEHHETYRQLISVYARIYDRLRDEFDTIAAFQNHGWGEK